MSHLFTLKFTNEASAQQVVDTLKHAQKQQLITLEDAAMFIRQPNGKPRIRQLHDLVEAGALGGAFWGFLVGLLFFMPFLGAAIGAGAGAFTGKFSDIGIDDDFIKQVGNALQPGDVALFLLTNNEVADKVLPELKPYQFQLLRTSLSDEDEAKLREMLGREMADTHR